MLPFACCCTEARVNPRTGERAASTSFTAHDKDVLQQLPMILRNEFPFVVTHRAAIPRTLMDSCSTLVVSPASFSQWAATVKEHHALRLLQKNEDIACLVGLMKKAGSADPALRTATLLEPHVNTPGPGYFINIYLHGVDEVRRRQHYKQLMQLTHSVVWRSDHCHKPPKTIRTATGAKASEGTGFLVGSHMQIMGFWNVASTALDELSGVLQLARKRSEELGSVSDILGSSITYDSTCYCQIQPAIPPTVIFSCIHST